jgi:hypothetical protein
LANFKKIYESEKFQALGADDKVAVRDRFYETRVMPLAQERGLDPEQTKVKFDAKYNISNKPAPILEQAKGKATNAISSLQAKLRNRYNKVDRDTGINHWAFRGDLSEMTGAEEKSNFLNDILGPNNWGVGDEGDDDFVISTKEGLDRLGLGHLWTGKPIAIDEAGTTGADFFADTRGAAPAVAGGILGGMATGGLGFIPAMLASGLGAGVMKGLDELRQTYADGGRYQKQSGEEVWGDMKTEAAFAAGGEGVGRALRPIGRYFMGPNRGRPFTAFGKQPVSKSSVEPALRKTAKEAAEKGVILPIAKATGKNRLLGFFQRMSDTVTGNPRAKENARSLAKWGKEITGHDIGAEVSQQKFGEGMYNTAKSMAKSLDKEKVKAFTSARQGLERAKNLMRGKKVRVDEDLGVQVRETIVKAHDDFMEASSVNYAKGLDAAGVHTGEKVFNSAPLRNLALAKQKNMLKTQDTILKSGKVKKGTKFSTATNEVTSKLDQFAKLEKKVSFDQLTTLRKDLGRAAYSGDMHSGVAAHDATDMLKVVDGIIDDFQGVPRNAGNGQIMTSKWTKALENYREANAAYHRGITPFKDILTKSITQDLTKRGAVQPSLIVNALKGESKEQIGNLMRIVNSKNPALAKQVKAEFFDDVLWGKTIDEGRITANALSENIGKLKKGVLETIYDKDATKIKTLASQLRRYGHGDLVLDDAIAEGGVVGKLAKVLETAKAEDAFLRTNFAKIAEQGPNMGGAQYGKMIDLAMKDAGAAKELLSLSNPQQIQHARSIMLRKLMNTMSVKSQRGKGDVLDESALKMALSNLGAYTSKEGDNALKIFLGPDKFKEITTLAKVADASVTVGSSGLVAMSIALKPFAHLGQLGEMHILSRLLSRPSWVNHFVQGSKSKAWRAGSDSAMRAFLQTTSAAIAEEVENADFKDEMKRLQEAR